MPIYDGNSKVKDLYYGGTKIKEAYYNGNKVYSSGPLYYCYQSYDSWLGYTYCYSKIENPSSTDTIYFVSGSLRQATSSSELTGSMTLRQWALQITRYQSGDLYT